MLEIKYANAHSIPYLAVNAGHGEIKSLANMKNGIQITIRSLNKITVNKDNTATVQGGATNLDITKELWAAKKQTGKSCSQTAFPNVPRSNARDQ